MRPRSSACGWAAAIPLVLASSLSCLAQAGEETTGSAATPTPARMLAPPPGMLLVPEGVAQVGTELKDIEPLIDENRMMKPVLAAETPRQQVLLPAFFLDKTEVTNAQYRIFLEATGHPAPEHWKDGMYPEGQDHYPVTNISYHDAEAFAHWSLRRLPTQEEFERAARGDDGRLYPWGDQWDPKRSRNGETGSSSAQGPSAVGSYPKGQGPFGHLDLCGNVAEWTSSYFLPYDGFDTKAFAEEKKSSSRNKRNRGGSYEKDIFIDWGRDARVVKGGTFGSFAVECRIPFRAYLGEENTVTGVAFRTAKSANPGLDFLDGEIAKIDRRLPDLDRTQALGVERFEHGGDDGAFILDARCLAFVPVKSVKFSTLDEFRNASQKRPQMIGVLAANFALVQPTLDPGTYLVEYSDDKKQGQTWLFRNVQSGEVDATSFVTQLDAKDNGLAQAVLGAESVDFHFNLPLATAKKPSQVVTQLALKVSPDTFPNR